MNHEEIDNFINELRTRLINERHVVVEGRYFNKNPQSAYDKIEIELYNDKPTEIPQVLIVWENGETSRAPWNDITDVRHDGVKSVYKYCPIELGQIVPPRLRNEVYRVFQHHQVSLKSY